MDAVLEALRAQHAELAGLLGPLTDEDWSRPSRCPGWSVSDVVLHLAQTDEMAIASVEGRFAEVLEEFVRGLPPSSDVDDGAGAMVEAERGATGAAVGDRWRAGADRLDALLAGADPHGRVQWVAGTLSVHTLATTRLAECWIHTGDVAEGLGVELAPTDRLRFVARLAWRTIPYAFDRAGRPRPGPVAFHLTAPDGSTWDFEPSDGTVAATTVTGSALDLCRVAGQRADAADTDLRAEGPDAAAVLELVRTFA